MSAVLTWDSDAWRKARDAKLLAWMQGNVAAVDTVLAFSSIAETWDDLYDRDKMPAPERINEAFVLALVKLQTNEFYKANEALFYSQAVTAINAWMDANSLQRSRSDHHRMLAWFLRSIGHEMACLAAFRVGGWEHLRAVSLEMRLFFQHEDFTTWEHRHAPAP